MNEDEKIDRGNAMSCMTVSITRMDIDSNLFDLDLKVEYEYYKGHKGRMYMKNGDPGYPDEPSEVEILTVTDSNGHAIALTDEEVEDIENKITFKIEAEHDRDEGYEDL